MSGLSKEENITHLDYTNKIRKNVRELLKLEFEVIAIVGLIVGLVSIDFSEIPVSIIPAFLIVVFYYLICILSIMGILYDYILARKKITEERVDLIYKLIFIQIILTFGIFPPLFGSLPFWLNVCLDIVTILTVLLYGFILLFQFIKIKKLKKQ